ASAISALLLLLLFSRVDSVSAQSPSFVTQPGDQLVRRGVTVTLTASAAGTPPLSFQWKFNGADLALATNSTLVLTNVSPTQDGRYFVQVANRLGSITSAEAKVTVCWDVVLSSAEETKATVDFSGGLLQYAHVAVNDRGEVFTIPEWDTSSRNQEFIVVKSDPSDAEVWRHTVASTMFPD